MQETIQLPPILKYPGGKTKLVPVLKKYYDLHRDHRLVAPFCGGLGDVLGLMPRTALLNDRFPALINLYRKVKEGFTIKNPIQHSDKAYYLARDRFNTISVPLMLPFYSQEAAELLIYLNRHCFNGLIRANSMGGFNTSVGKPPRGQDFKYPLDYQEYAGIFKSWEFTCQDFNQVEVLESDFAYLDPPYDELNKTSSFTQYGTGEPFDWARQEELAYLASKYPCPTLASNHATDRIVDLYTKLGASIEYVSVSRAINSKISARSDKVVEILASWRIQHSSARGLPPVTPTRVDGEGNGGQ
jgi:DNA adenine methylase